MLTIDGSYREGGGQILRTSLALSLCTLTPFRIEKIRAGRKQPGLGRQHLAAVQAAAEIGKAEVSGNALGSQELTFAPSGIVPGEYKFSVGTAGSATLVLQTVLPALMLASGPSFLTLEGGTHNPAAPPYDFLAKAFLPLLSRIGPRVHLQLVSYGFYPAGGGVMRATIEPAAALRPLELTERGALRGYRARSLVSNLPRHIGERELAVIAEKLSWPISALTIEMVPSRGPGNVLLLEVESENITEVFSAFGERGVRAETVAEKAAAAARRYLETDVVVGEHLADQLLLPMALAQGGLFTTLEPSRHTCTNIDTIRKFLPVRIRVFGHHDRAWTIEIKK
ncbi:MAG TPA: RNA 3'-terminal phosphate cyclase [Candidatus Acidoferrales bacterium]|nr:RNA 3'-terminal phosphate cyclase [Candidatus Acidoferrales bacterium]